MPFNIRMGLPEMDAVWTDLSTRSQAGKLNNDEQASFKKLVKALGFLKDNPIDASSYPSSLPPSPNLAGRAHIETTQKLREAGEIIGIAVLDHLIFNRTGDFSFLEGGGIPA